MNKIYDAVVIGAGQAGLASAYHLQQASLNFVVLESADKVGGSWHKFYDSLKLFSPANHSSLPELSMAGDSHRYPTRDEVAAYLQTYAKTFDFPIKTNAKVVAIEKIQNAFHIELANGETLTAQSVIVATGPFNNPHTPQLTGQTAYEGKLLHAIDYANPTPYAGQRVVIVGGMNTAVQIGTELAEVADVTLATRQPIPFAPQRLFGKDIHFWINLLGLDQLAFGQRFNPLQKGSVVDDGRYKTAVLQGKPDRRPMFSTFTKDGVVWENGDAEKVDTVIFATGYRPNMPFLHQLDALNENGHPNQKNGVSQTVQGLYFVGLPWQRAHRSATLRGVGPDANYVVGQIKRAMKD